MASRGRRSPSVVSEMVGVVVALVVTCAIAGFLWVGVIATLGAVGLIRGARDPGPATALEAWLGHAWPLVLMVELLLGALVARRMCRGFFRGKRSSPMPDAALAPARTPNGLG